MAEWEEASMLNEQQLKNDAPPEMTTDDLVMMVGEANINLKHSERIVRFLKQQVVNLTDVVSKKESVNLSLKEQINTLLKEKNSSADFITKHNQEKESFHNRIVQLENQLQAIAEEREALKKIIQDLAEAEKKKAVKRKK